jgi:hypothetical protein
VLLVSLAFADAGHSGFVETADLSYVGTLLALHAVVKQHLRNTANSLPKP